MSFSGLATVTASTKRSPAIVGGVGGAPAAKLASLDILPPMPLSPYVAEQYRLKSPRDAYVTYADGSPDVLEGDLLTTGGVTYTVRGVGEWPTENAYLEIILERVKGT